jgi:hypothetical protein
MIDHIGKTIGKISSAVEAKLDEAITAFKGGFTL